MHKLLVLALTISTITACSSKKKFEMAAHPNNTEVKQKLPAFVKVDLPAEGHIEFKQGFKSYGFCEAMKPDMKIIVTPFKGSQEFETTKTCHKASKTLFVKTKELLPAGSYKVDLKFEADNSSMMGHPVVGATYKDPDFASEDDHIMHGAKPWAANQKVAGVVNPGIGDQTDWLKIEPSGGSMQITLLEKSQDNNIEANVYWLDPEKDKIVGRKLLRSNQRITIPDPEEKEVYVKVVAKDLVPETHYTLFRKDAGKVEVKDLAVVDFIQVGNTTWNALLKAIEGVKIGDEIRIKGQKSNGVFVPIGKCKVTSVDASFISCTINAKITTNYINYSGQFVAKPE